MIIWQKGILDVDVNASVVIFFNSFVRVGLLKKGTHTHTIKIHKKSKYLGAMFIA